MTLKPCRWCGGPARIAWTDNEGEKFVRCDTQGCLVATSGTVALAKFQEKFSARQPKAPEPTEADEIAKLKRLLKRHGKKFLGLAE